MNERIKELAHQVGLLTYNPSGVPTKLEKFAELIVRECVSVYERDPSIYHEVNIANILEHFGLEL